MTAIQSNVSLIPVSSGFRFSTAKKIPTGRSVCATLHRLSPLESPQGAGADRMSAPGGSGTGGGRSPVPQASSGFRPTLTKESHCAARGLSVTVLPSHDRELTRAVEKCSAHGNCRRGVDRRHPGRRLDRLSGGVLHPLERGADGRVARECVWLRCIRAPKQSDREEDPVVASRCARHVAVPPD